MPPLTTPWTAILFIIFFFVLVMGVPKLVDMFLQSKKKKGI